MNIGDGESKVHSFHIIMPQKILLGVLTMKIDKSVVWPNNDIRKTLAVVVSIVDGECYVLTSTLPRCHNNPNQSTAAL